MTQGVPLHPGPSSIVKVLALRLCALQNSCLKNPTVGGRYDETPN